MAWMVLPDGDYAVANNEIYFIPVQYEDAAGAVVTPPAGDTITVATTGTFAVSLAVAVTTMPGSSPPVVAISLTPMVVESDAGNGGGKIGISLTDSAGLVVDSASQNVLFDIVNPALVPTQFGINVGGVVTQSQATPTDPGP